MTKKPLILITNDDGIASPGLLAAAEAVAPLGELLIVAPHTQQTGAGRSFQKIADTKIYKQTMTIATKQITAYSINATPAQVTAVAISDLASQPIALAISGINFGENLGSGVTISGTIGAAIQAAVEGVPALAVSLETPTQYHNSYSAEVDFTVAAHFTHYFAKKMLTVTPLPFDVDVLKLDVPTTATLETPWRVTTISRQSYHLGIPAPPEKQGITVQPGYVVGFDETNLEPNSDIKAVAKDKIVSVSPLSINLSSRVKLSTVHNLLTAID